MEIHNSKILIIDDEPDLLALVKELLFREGFQCAKTAVTCREAESQIRGKTWHLILLDVMLPDGNGFDLSCLPVTKIPRGFADLGLVRMTTLQSHSFLKNFYCASRQCYAGHTVFRKMKRCCAWEKLLCHLIPVR